MGKIALAALNLLHEVSKKLPNFDQRIRNNYYKSLKAYESEYIKPEHLIDDQKMDFLRFELERQYKAFSKELSK